MASQEIRLRSLGSRGVITDLDEYHIPADAFSAAENMVIKDGVPSAIGRIPRSGDSTVGGGGHYESTVMISGILSRNDSDTPEKCERNASAWRLDAGTPSTASLPGGPYLPLIDYNGESLWFDQSGIYPIIRWAQANTGSDSILGMSSSPAEGDRIITYTGTAVEDYYAGFYSAAEIIPQSYRIARAGSGWMEIADAYDGPTSGIGFVHNEHGYLGLSVQVREAEASWASDTLTAATNNSFTAEVNGMTEVLAGDQLGVRDTSSQVTQVVSVDTATTITTLSGITVPAGPSIFRIMRSMVGTTGCLHRGRLYVAGCSWQPNAVFIMPQGYVFSDAYNGIDSPNTDKMNARLAKYINIPDDQAAGKVVALLSTGGPLLVLRNDGAYYLHGEYPNNSVSLLPGIDGCLDVRAAIQTKYGQVIAGRHGIYIHNNGGVRDITRNRRKSEWRRLVERMYKTGGISGTNYVTTSCASFGQYLFITLTRSDFPLSVWEDLTLTDKETWVYDMESGNWQGNVTDMSAWYFSLPGVIALNEDFDAGSLVWSSPEGGYARYRQRDFEMADQNDANLDTTAEQGMMFETGPISGLGENDRLTNVKITYEMEAASAATATLRVSTDHGDGFETTENFTTDDSGNGPITKRTKRTFLSANAGALGATGNRVRIKVQDVSTDGDVLGMKVHGLSAIVRRRLRRA